MKARKTLTLLQIMAAGGIVGAAIMGSFFNGADVYLGKLDLNSIGAMAGAILSAVYVKMSHFL